MDKEPDQDIYDEDELSSSSSDDTSTLSSPPSLPDERIMFEENKPLVLDLHDMTTEKQRKALATELKKKVRKKKKSKAPKLKHDSSSSSVSESSLPKADNMKEEFYDARESYHGIPAHQQVAKSLPHATLAPVPATPVIQTVRNSAEQSLNIKTTASHPATLSADRAIARAVAATAVKKPTQ